jgi:AraC family transcriptional regulator
LGVRRIEALEGGHAVPLVPEAPLLSSSHIAWEGILLEEHSTPTQETQLRQLPTIFLALHTGSALQQDWRNEGKSFRTLTTPGSVHLLTPGPVRSLSHRDPLDCIVLTLEPGYFHRALDDSLRSERIELIDRFALEDARIDRLIKALHAETREGAPTGTLFGQSIATALAVYLAQRYASSVPTLHVIVAECQGLA